LLFIGKCALILRKNLQVQRRERKRAQTAYAEIKRLQVKQLEERADPVTVRFTVPEHLRDEALEQLDQLQYAIKQRALDITTDRVREYISQRQTENASNASINRDLSALKRMFSLAVQAGKLSSKPYIPALDENNAARVFRPWRLSRAKKESTELSQRPGDVSLSFGLASKRDEGLGVARFRRRGNARSATAGNFQE